MNVNELLTVDQLKWRLPFPEPVNDVQRAANRAEWVRALRSGDFKQGYKALVSRERDGTFTWCCLGVACAMATGLKAYPVPDHDYLQLHAAPLRWSCSILPGDLRSVLGLATSAGDFGSDRSLTTMNDDGETFDAIANVIEAAPTGLLSNGVDTEG